MTNLLLSQFLCLKKLFQILIFTRAVVLSDLHSKKATRKIISIIILGEEFGLVDSRVLCQSHFLELVEGKCGFFIVEMLRYKIDKLVCLFLHFSAIYQFII